MKWTLPKFTIILAVALTVWLWPSIFGGKVLLPLDIMAHTPPFEPASPGPIHNELIGDMLLENFAWKTFQREAVEGGELPLWNPYSFCGHPLYTTGQTSTFYPLNAIFMVVPIPRAYVVFTWAHLFMGGVFAFLFFRRVGVSGFGASVGGLMFAMSTYFAVRILWPMLLGSAVWLPLMLLWIDWMANPGPSSGRSRQFLPLLYGIPLGAVLFAMPILSGFFEITFYAFAACGLYTLFMGVRLLYRERSIATAAVFLGKVGAVTVLAALLAAPQLLPFFEVMKLNVRAGELTYEEAVKSGLKPREAWTFIAPDALGNPSKHHQVSLETRDWEPIRAKTGQDFHYFGTMNYVESTNYLGLLTLSFVALSVLAPGRRRLYFWTLLGIGLAMAFATPLYWVFFHLVPGTDQVRTPFRWTMLVMFAGTYLAAIGADDWYARLSAPARRLTQAAATAKLAVVFALALVVLVLLYRPARLVEVAERIMSADARASSVFESPMALASLLWMNAARFSTFALGALLIIAVAYWRAWGPKAIAVFSTAALLFIAVDLGQATWRFNTHADPAILEQKPPIVEHLESESDKDIFRLGRYGWQRMYSANLPTLHGIQDYGGYDSIILTDYAHYLEAIEHQKQLPYNIIMTVEQKSSLDSPLYRLLNNRYLVSVKPLEHPDYDPVDVPGNLKLSRLKPERELGRAFLVNRVRRVLNLERAIEAMASGKMDLTRMATVEATPATASKLVGPLLGAPGTATITEYGLNRVRVETSASGRQFLVLCDVHYPGWRAYVNGRPADIIRTNGVFRGVSVPAGNHTVEFRFQPARLRIGAVLSIVVLAGLVVVQAVQVVAGRRREDQPAAPSVPAS